MSQDKVTIKWNSIQKSLFKTGILTKRSREYDYSKDKEYINRQNHMKKTLEKANKELKSPQHKKSQVSPEALGLIAQFGEGSFSSDSEGSDLMDPQSKHAIGPEMIEESKITLNKKLVNFKATVTVIEYMEPEEDLESVETDETDESSAESFDGLPLERPVFGEDEGAEFSSDNELESDLDFLPVSNLIPEPSISLNRPVSNPSSPEAKNKLYILPEEIGDFDQQQLVEKPFPFPTSSKPPPIPSNLTKPNNSANALPSNFKPFRVSPPEFNPFKRSNLMQEFSPISVPQRISSLGMPLKEFTSSSNIIVPTRTASLTEKSVPISVHG
jgi:hypothetical protein